MPGKDDLGWGLTLRSGDLGDDRICQRVQLHELVRSRLPVARADRRVALQVDAPFTVEDVDARLVEVRVDLDLVDGGLDLAAGNDIGELRQDAVAHADRFDKASFDKGLHLSPGDVMRWGSDFPVFRLPVDAGAHPVDQVEIDVLELELLQTGAARCLDIVIVIVPQLGRDKELFTRHTSRDALFKSLANLLLVGVDLRRVDVAISVLQDRLLDDILGVLVVQERAQANDRDLVPAVHREPRARLWLNLCFSLYHSMCVCAYVRTFV